MPTILKIISHELVNKDYLRLNVVSGIQSCGSIDIMYGKINFNIGGKYFFKGMEFIKNVELEYKGEQLVFLFRNGRNLAINCTKEEFSTISKHKDLGNKCF
ncbi:hypothetical protein [Sphingobacterium ginsenosidimutans]|uniref:Uncharacterized protein n=1 Tax=Sphingobacterium ginsenosidimutans TaxID=687845 RepID=A0ABP8A6U2_9SPHI